MQDLLIQRIRERSTRRYPIPTGLPPCITPIAAIRAVAFDVGGTLFMAPVDPSIEHEAKLFQETLSCFGLELRGISVRSVLERIRAVEHTMRATLGIPGVHPEIDCAESYGCVLEEMHCEGVLNGILDNNLVRVIVADFGCRRCPHWPMPDLKETLAELVRRGILLGIVSNAQHFRRYVFEALCGQSLADMGFQQDLVLWSCDVGVSKPSLAIFDRLIGVLRGKYGIAPHETLFVGNDLLVDICPANQSGLHTALLAADERSLNLRRDDARTEGVHAESVLTELRQVLDIVPVRKRPPGSNHTPA